MGRGTWVALVVVLGACGGGDDDGGGGDAFAVARSQILVSEASVDAWFYGSDWQRSEPFEDGECRLFPRDAGDAGEPPALVGVGTLTLEGSPIDATGLDVPRSAIGTYDLREQVSILDGATRIDLVASGSDEVEAFEIGAGVPARPQLDGAQAEGWPVLTAGEALELTWTDADQDSQVSLFLTDRVASATVVCIGTDTGSLVVPADLMSDFLAVATWEESPDTEVASSLIRARRAAIELGDGHTIGLSVGRSVAFSPAPE